MTRSPDVSLWPPFGVGRLDGLDRWDGELGELGELGDKVHMYKGSESATGGV